MRLPLALLLAAVASSPVRLAYERGPGAEACADEAELREAVEARLGWVPWDEAAPHTVAVRIRRGASGFEATVARLEPGKGEVGSRALAAPGPGCAELSASVALAIAIAVDPLGKGPPAPAPAPVVAAEPGFELSLGAGALAVLGAAPGPTVSARFAAAGRRGAGSLGVEGRADLPGREEVAGGAVSAGVVAGSVVPCLHRGALSGCALGTFGVLRASGEGFHGAAQVDAPYVAAGVRFGWEIPLGERLVARAGAELLAHLSRTTLVDSATREVRWELPAISAGLGAAVVAVFP